MLTSNDMHFIKIVVDLITLYDLSTNFTNNPRMYMISKTMKVKNRPLMKTTNYYGYKMNNFRTGLLR